MPPSIFIHAKNVFLHQLSPAPASITRAEPGPAEYSDGEKRVWARGFGAASTRHAEPIERCEGGAPDHGPMEHYDSEGVPLCKRCWDALAADSAASAAGLETREYRDLGGGERISLGQALKEVAELGAGWRLGTPHELFALVDYSQQNQHGAYTRDPTLKDGPYWTDQETPWFEGGRVVVGFNDGVVYNGDDNYRAFARAVRVSGQ